MCHFSQFEELLRFQCPFSMDVVNVFKPSIFKLSDTFEEVMGVILLKVFFILKKFADLLSFVFLLLFCLESSWIHTCFCFQCCDFYFMWQSYDFFWISYPYHLLCSYESRIHIIDCCIWI